MQVNSVSSLQPSYIDLPCEGKGVIHDTRYKSYPAKSTFTKCLFHLVMQDKRCDIRYYVVVIRSHFFSFNHYLFHLRRKLHKICLKQLLSLLTMKGLERVRKYHKMSDQDVSNNFTFCKSVIDLPVWSELGVENLM